MSVLAAGLLFICTPIMLYDGDGPIICKEGPKIRLAGIAARERDGSCKPGHPCPESPPSDALAALISLLGTKIGERKYAGTPYPHTVIKAQSIICISEGSAKGNRTSAYCKLPNGKNLNCEMLRTRTVLIWKRYWNSRVVCQ